MVDASLKVLSNEELFCESHVEKWSSVTQLTECISTYCSSFQYLTMLFFATSHYSNTENS